MLAWNVLSVVEADERNKEKEIARVSTLFLSLFKPSYYDSVSVHLSVVLNDNLSSDYMFMCASGTQGRSGSCRNSRRSKR
jgi:hypothetical protein